MAGSYTPLYRKYRPQRFDELIGQELISKTLSNAVKLDRIVHAYLFTGPRGTGKTSSARIFAKSLNCVESPTVNPCGKCPNCIDISNSNSVDVIEIDAASNRKVEDARNLLEKVQFVPVSGRYKIYIIDEVHMLTTEAFNTLLKTLEEPPKNLVFILATTEAHKVLTTIISRCQRFDFRRVPQDLISQNLKEISGKENIKINDKAISLIAKKSYGGMRDALGMLDQASVLSGKDEEISEDAILSMLGSLSEDTLFDLVNCLVQRDNFRLLEHIDKIIQSSEPVNVMRELINYFRKLLIIKSSPDLKASRLLIDFSESLLPNMKTQAENFEINEIVQIIEKLAEYEKTIKNASQQHLWLEVALISICHRQDIQVLKDMEQRIQKLEQAISSGNVSEIRQTPAKIPTKTPVITPPKIHTVSDPIEASPPKKLPVSASVETISPKNDSVKAFEASSTENKKEEPALADAGNITDAWNKLLANNTNIPSQSFFKGLGTPVRLDSEKIIITFANENTVKQATQDSKLNLMKNAAKELFGTIPVFIIRTPMPEDNDLKKNIAEITAPSEAPVQKQEPLKPKSSSQITIDTESHQEIDEEIIEKLDDINKTITPVNISEEAKMIIDIFSGKVVE